VNLFRAEISRLVARRFTWVMLAVVVAILATVAVGITLGSNPVTPETMAQAERDADRTRADIEQMREQCEQEQRNPSSGGGQMFPPGLDCAENFDSSDVRAEYYLPYVFDFRQEGPTLIGIAGGLVALLGFAVGASFVGAEWSSSGMANLLLWRPRRVPVLLTKLAAVLGGVLVLGAACVALFTAALWMVAELRGVSSGTTADFWRSLGLRGLRVLVLGAATTAIGFSLASVGRHTATALGVGVGYLIVGQIGLPIILSLTETARPERYLLSSYVAAWVNDGITMQDYSVCDFAQPTAEPCSPVEWSVTTGQSAAVGVTLLVLLVGSALWQMARRDVT
jgi:ABC-2 type transport system permease protein